MTVRNETASRKIEFFQKAVLQFWASNGRHSLPWRQTRDPWKILLAEVLLRKTTSAQAQAVYVRLQDLMPAEIAKMDTEVLAGRLEPLGIHQIRAVQLQQIARTAASAAVEDFRSDEFLRSLPGVGRYISNAVRACAFGDPTPALDTNMIRILERVFSWKSARARAREDILLWKFAEALVPEEQSREYNWGVLDFGAAVCTFRNPKCSVCSIREICDYYRSVVQV